LGFQTTISDITYNLLLKTPVSKFLNKTQTTPDIHKRAQRQIILTC